MGWWRFSPSGIPLPAYLSPCALQRVQREADHQDAEGAADGAGLVGFLVFGGEYQGEADENVDDDDGYAHLETRVAGLESTSDHLLDSGAHQVERDDEECRG